jgi:hypothetical protein
LNFFGPFYFVLIKLTGAYEMSASNWVATKIIVETIKNHKLKESVLDKRTEND